MKILREKKMHGVQTLTPAYFEYIKVFLILFYFVRLFLDKIVPIPRFQKLLDQKKDNSKYFKRCKYLWAYEQRHKSLDKANKRQPYSLPATL